MLEVILKDFLEDELDIPVFLELPVNPQFPLIVIEKTGSSENEHIYSATFAIQSYDSSLYKAATLNESVKTAMESFIDEDEIASCRLNSDYNFTDTQSKRYRYQAVYDITAL